MSDVPEITIRPMYATDLRRGFLPCLASLKPCELTDEQAIEVFRQRMRQKIRTYVALLDGRIVGTATLLIEPKFIHSGGVVGHIEDVAVHQAYQAHGVGALLVKHVLEECRAAKCYKVILDCAEKVIPFYEKLGFHKWERAMRIDL
ncbi:MAG: GNAT family N-acetyltransferase [Planctomycetaceae bacterium]|nr:GNAT family N-acetyltransferase [Planctomycetaceae bacterium]